MGMRICSSSEGVGRLSGITPTGNPDPVNFRIEGVSSKGTYSLMHVVYPDCRNYEGQKVLLFKGKAYRDDNGLDPHFNEDSNLVARFVPTKEGWKMGMDLMRVLTDKKEKEKQDE